MDPTSTVLTAPNALGLGETVKHSPFPDAFQILLDGQCAAIALPCASPIQGTGQMLPVAGGNILPDESLLLPLAIPELIDAQSEPLPTEELSDEWLSSLAPYFFGSAEVAISSSEPSEPKYASVRSNFTHSPQALLFKDQSLQAAPAALQAKVLSESILVETSVDQPSAATPPTEDGALLIPTSSIPSPTRTKFQQAPLAGASIPYDLASLVDTLAMARELSAPRTGHLTVQHAEFGAVSLRFEAKADELSVSIKGADPDLLRAVATATPPEGRTTQNEQRDQPAPQSQTRHSHDNSNGRRGSADRLPERVSDAVLEREEQQNNRRPHDNARYA